jgi:cyanophycin synthetase
MFAAAMAHALGRTPAEIGAALRTFLSDPADNHGRLNRYRGAPFEFLVDYCHNRHGIEAIGAMASAMAVQGRRLLAFALAGNHRDGDFEAAGREAARHFDALVAYAPPERYLRGRTAAEIAGRIAGAFRAARGDPSSARTAEDAAEAARLLFDAAGPGDLVIATGANQQPFIDELRNRWPSLAPG